MCVCVFHVAAVSAPVLYDVCRSISAHHVTSCSFAAVLARLAAVLARVACVSVAALLAPFRSCLGPLQPFRLHASTVLFAAAVSTRMSMVCLVLPCFLGLEGSVLLHVMSLACVSIMFLRQSLNWNWTTHAAVGGHCVFCLHVMSWLVLHVMSRLVAMCWSLPQAVAIVHMSCTALVSLV